MHFVLYNSQNILFLEEFSICLSVCVCVCISDCFIFQRSVIYCLLLFITDFSQLLWIILLASCAALIIQSLAANLGVVTGK